MAILTLEEKIERHMKPKMRTYENKNIEERIPILSPSELKRISPVSEKASNTICNSINLIESILKNKDEHFIAIIGPCSIHDFNEGYELARIVNDFRKKVKDKMVIVYRAYFQKPRTTVGWRGLAYEPDMMTEIRRFLIKVNELGLPCATEFLDRSFYRRIGDLISYGSIGARTSESEDHRNWASGYLMPMGFKNNTQSNIKVAVAGIVSSRDGKLIFDEDDYGVTCYTKTRGNPYTHLILRGGESGPNYDTTFVKSSEELLESFCVEKNVIIDCGHDNSKINGKKDYKLQLDVLENVIQQRVNGNRNIKGVMLEVNINPGQGNEYGYSRTDPCLEINEAIEALKRVYNCL